MDFKKELVAYAKLTEAEIAPYLDRKPDELYAPLRDIIGRGGKRLRPALCMVSCEAVGGKKKDALLLSAAIEMVHNFTLIHDDIADKSELRRGKPCLHHIHGLGLAINAGDGLFSAAYEALFDATGRMGEKECKRINSLIAKRVTEVCEGQAYDIGWVQNKRWDITEKDYFIMIRDKTGALMSASCEAGAIAGKGTEKQIRALSEFGMGIGVGFQIQDDILNLRADEKKYGKEIGGDINEGKRTLMVIYTLSACTPAEKKWLIGVLDKEKSTQEEIRDAIALIEKYGAIDKAGEVAKKMVKEGKKGLTALPDSKSKELLIAIADYLIERDF